MLEQKKRLKSKNSEQKLGNSVSVENMVMVSIVLISDRYCKNNYLNLRLLLFQFKKKCINVCFINYIIKKYSS